MAAPGAASGIFYRSLQAKPYKIHPYLAVLVYERVWVCACVFFSELCWGKAMVIYTKPQQKKKEECERLRGESVCVCARVCLPVCVYVFECVCVFVCL